MERSRFQPDFRLIRDSELWREQIKPWLESMYFDSLEDKCPPFANNPAANLEAYHFWRGFADAVRTIAELPDADVAAERAYEAEEKKREAIQQARDARNRARASL